MPTKTAAFLPVYGAPTTRSTAERKRKMTENRKYRPPQKARTSSWAAGALGLYWLAADPPRPLVPRDDPLPAQLPPHPDG